MVVVYWWELELRREAKIHTPGEKAPECWGETSSPLLTLSPVQFGPELHFTVVAILVIINIIISTYFRVLSKTHSFHNIATIAKSARSVWKEYYSWFKEGWILEVKLHITFEAFRGETKQK